MPTETEKQLLEKIENLEKMLETCKRTLEEYRKDLNIICNAFTKKN